MLDSSRGSCSNAEQREANEALVAILNNLAGLDGPKVVVLVSPGLVPADGNNSNCQWMYDDAGVAASAARVHIYGLVPHQLGISASTGGGVGSDGFLRRRRRTWSSAMTGSAR